MIPPPSDIRPKTIVAPDGKLPRSPLSRVMVVPDALATLVPASIALGWLEEQNITCLLVAHCARVTEKRLNVVLVTAIEVFVATLDAVVVVVPTPPAKFPQFGTTLRLL